MKYLSVDKLDVRYLAGTEEDCPLIPRHYTLTHSDFSGRLYLTIGSQYDRGQIYGWYTRLMRDEVLAEWQNPGDEYSLAIYCHVSGGFVFGWAGLRYSIFRQELPLVLEAIRWGDRGIFNSHPHLDNAPLSAHFHSTKRRYNIEEHWGTPGNYR